MGIVLVFFLRFATKRNDMDDDKYIRFDWAAKRMLRDKANFGVFEGLITVLLNEPVHIVEILESESNQNDADDKFNRVDIKARAARMKSFLWKYSRLENFIIWRGCSMVLQKPLRNTFL